MAGLTMLRVVGGADLQREEEKRIAEESAARQQQPVILGLAAHVKTCWDAARDAKRPIEDIMMSAKRQRNGEYEPTKLVEIRKQGGSEIFMRITEVKCRSAEAWIRDILLDSGSIPWELRPTPLPDLSPVEKEEVLGIFGDKLAELVMMYGQAPNREQMGEIKAIIEQDFRFKMLQKAQERADRMGEKIQDQFAEGGWYQAFDDFVTDLVTYPAAFVKGPVLRKNTKLAWAQGPDGKTTLETKEAIVPEYERVDPFNIYPEPGITHINEGYLFQHHPLSRSDLSALIDVPGYDSDAIRELLANGAQQSWFFNSIELTKDELERKFQSWRSPTAVFDALEFWGKVSGKMLIDWGLTSEEVPDPAKEYDANVWLVGNVVIKAVMNFDPLGEKPYAKASFFKVPGAFWGMGIPEMISDVQDVCNASARSLVNNMGLASGPQVEINIERTPSNEDVTQLYPWKVWQVLNDPMGTTAPAVRFNQPNDNSAALMQVYEKFSRLADEHSGIPAYVSGDISVTGAGRTSSGLSMLMGAAGKGIRQVVSHIDNDVVKVIVQRQFVFNMRYDDDESIKGDVVVVPRGAVNLAVKETINTRRVEFLQATANPFDLEVIGMEGRAAILREVAKGLQMPDEDIVPSREKMQMKAKIQQLLGPPAGQEGEQGQGQQLQGTTPTQPDGSPKGGAAGNTVSNKITGAA